MTDQNAAERIRQLIVRAGRAPDLAAAMAARMNRREISEGIALAAAWDEVLGEANEWLIAVGERLLQDEATAET